MPASPRGARPVPARTRGAARVRCPRPASLRGPALRSPLDEPEAPLVRPSRPKPAQAPSPPRAAALRPRAPCARSRSRCRCSEARQRRAAQRGAPGALRSVRGLGLRRPTRGNRRGPSRSLRAPSPISAGATGSGTSRAGPAGPGSAGSALSAPPAGQTPNSGTTSSGAAEGSEAGLGPFWGLSCAAAGPAPLIPGVRGPTGIRESKPAKVTWDARSALPAGTDISTRLPRAAPARSPRPSRGPPCEPGRAPRKHLSWWIHVIIFLLKPASTDASSAPAARPAAPVTK